VIVTGGAGFIGSALVEQLVLGGHEVLTIDALSYAGNRASLAAVEGGSHYRFLKADIADRKAMAEAFAGFDPEAVINLAAESHVDRSIAGADAFIHSNIVGSFTMLEAARHYWAGLPPVRRQGFRFVQVSTDEVYGSLGADGHFLEADRYDPSSPYAASKAAADHLVRAWHRTYGLPVVLAVSSNNYGPRQYPEKLIPLMILNGLTGKLMPVYGDGHNVREWLHVEDHARALALIAAQGRVGETYHVGTGDERRNIDVVKQICDLLDEMVPSASRHAELIRFVADRPGHDARYALDAGKLGRELGWRPLQRFDEGLRSTVRWYLDNRAWWEPLLESR
jgi:dTDP-glucose 4,6-dehydratase